MRSGERWTERSGAVRSGAEEKATRTDERDARSAPLGTNKRSLDQKPVGGRDGRMKTKAKKRTFRGGENGGSNVLRYATSNRMGGHTVNQSSRARKAGAWFSRPLVCRASNQLRPKYAFCFETLFCSRAAFCPYVARACVKKDEGREGERERSGDG